MKLQTVLKPVMSIAIVLAFALASYHRPAAASQSIGLSTVTGAEMIPNTSDWQLHFQLAARGGDVGRLSSQ